MNRYQAINLGKKQGKKEVYALLGFATVEKEPPRTIGLDEQKARILYVQAFGSLERFTLWCGQFTDWKQAIEVLTLYLVNRGGD